MQTFAVQKRANATAPEPRLQHGKPLSAFKPGWSQLSPASSVLDWRMRDEAMQCGWLKRVRGESSVLCTERAPRGARLPCSLLQRPLSATTAAAAATGAVPVALQAAKAASGVPQRTRARLMQAAEVAGTAACPARKHLLLALMHATGAPASLCTNRLQPFAKFVPRRFCWGGSVAPSFAKFLQSFAVDRSVVNATGLFCQTFAPNALL